MTATPPDPSEQPLVNPFDDPNLETSAVWEDTVRRLSEQGAAVEEERSPTTDRFPKPAAAPTGAMERLYNVVQASMESLKTVFNKAASTLSRIRPFWEKGWRWWQQPLSQLRRILPRGVSAVVPDAVLTGVAIALVVVLLWGISSLLLGGKPAQVRRVPPPPPAVAAAASTESAATLDLPPDAPQIAAIQDQVAEITEQYATGLIQSVQANFRASRLTVMVGDRWYTLSADRQDSLANELLSRAQTLHFSKLDMIDGNGELLARSPVIGEAMIVLKRQLAQ